MAAFKYFQSFYDLMHRPNEQELNISKFVKLLREFMNKGNMRAQRIFTLVHKNDPAIFSNVIVKEDMKYLTNEADEIVNLKNAADQGNREAQLKFAYLYFNGQHIAKDENAAFHYFKLAADQGDLKSQLYVSNCYCDGVGVEKNKVEAIKYCELAANQGHMESQLFIANSYRFGRSIPQNQAKAVQYFKLAAIKGNLSAVKALETMSRLEGRIAERFAEPLTKSFAVPAAKKPKV
jgi:TPR repeat protein